MTHFASIEWWIDLVIVAYLVHIAATYSKPQLDRLFGGVSARTRKMSEKKRLRLESEVDAICSFPDGLILLSLQEVKCVLGFFLGGGISALSLWAYAKATTFTTRPEWWFAPLPPSFLLFVAVLMAVLSTASLKVATDKSDLLKIAMNRRLTSTTGSAVPPAP